MLELEPKYLNVIASHIIIISSLLCGFSVNFLANLVTNHAKSKLANILLICSALAGASFLVTIFTMVKIILITTEGYPLPIHPEDLKTSRVIGFGVFLLGICNISLMIALSGWLKSRKAGTWTTIIGAISLALILLNF